MLAMVDKGVSDFAREPSVVLASEAGGVRAVAGQRQQQERGGRPRREICLITASHPRNSCDDRPALNMVALFAHYQTVYVSVFTCRCAKAADPLQDRLSQNLLKVILLF